MEGIFESGAVEHIGYHNDDSDSTVSLVVETRHCSGWGTAHTLVIAGMIEMTGAKVAPADVVPNQVTFSIHRPVKLGARMLGRGRILSAGRTIITTQTEVYVGDTLVATGIVTFVVVKESKQT